MFFHHWYHYVYRVFQSTSIAPYYFGLIIGQRFRFHDDRGCDCHWFYKTNFCFNSFPFNDVLNFLFSYTGIFVSTPGISIFNCSVCSFEFSFPVWARLACLLNSSWLFEQFYIVKYFLPGGIDNNFTIDIMFLLHEKCSEQQQDNDACHYKQNCKPNVMRSFH